jgi:hypothetical protein
MAVVSSTRAQRSPEYYRAKRQKLIQQGTVKRRHAKTTKINMHGVKTKWTRYGRAREIQYKH